MPEPTRNAQQDRSSAGKVDISVVVLFYHGDAWVRTCVESLLNQSMERRRYELILADNGGATPALDKWRGEANVRIVRWASNLGFAGGNNRAAKMASGKVVLIVNQDVVVHRDCLHNLNNAFQKHPELEVIGANQLMVESLRKVDFAAPIPSTVGLYRLSGLGFADYHRMPYRIEPIFVDFVSGNGLGFRNPLPPAMEGYLFDERLFAYAEDLDLSLRLARNRCRMAILPSAVVFHFRQDLFGGTAWGRLKKFIHASGNRLLVYRRRLSKKAFVLKLPLLLAGIAGKVARMDTEHRINVVRLMAGAAIAPMAAADFLRKDVRQRKLPGPGGSPGRPRSDRGSAGGFLR